MAWTEWYLYQMDCLNNMVDNPGAPTTEVSFSDENRSISPIASSVNASSPLFIHPYTATGFDPAFPYLRGANTPHTTLTSSPVPGPSSVPIPTFVSDNGDPSAGVRYGVNPAQWTSTAAAARKASYARYSELPNLLHQHGTLPHKQRASNSLASPSLRFGATASAPPTPWTSAANPGSDFEPLSTHYTGVHDLYSQRGASHEPSSVNSANLPAGYGPRAISPYTPFTSDAAMSSGLESSYAGAGNHRPQGSTSPHEQWSFDPTASHPNAFNVSRLLGDHAPMHINCLQRGLSVHTPSALADIALTIDTQLGDNAIFGVNR